MKKVMSILASASLLLTMASTVEAFSKPTHKRFVLDAVKYMEAHPNTTNYNKLKAVANASGYTIEQFADVVGEGALDVDNFEDTFMCGNVSGDCVQSPVWGAGTFVVKYTAYWHFQNHTQGMDVHGNDFGGYNASKLAVAGTEDHLIASWLHGDHLDDGRGGQRGWWGREDSEYKSYQITEANYRQGTYSSYGMYRDFETAPFQPIDNLAQYWYSQFLAHPTAQTLGFSLHSTDLLQPHHTWTTSSHHHLGWELWVMAFYDLENLNDDALITNALNSFTPLHPQDTDIRPLLTEGGSLSYSQGGLVLSSTSHSDREQVAKVVVPHAIAMVVHVLNHAADQF